ncbi:MAG: hypothetical protein ABI151_03415 [Chitinophagaceae bacterium]
MKTEITDLLTGIKTAAETIKNSRFVSVSKRPPGMTSFPKISHQGDSGW